MNEKVKTSKYLVDTNAVVYEMFRQTSDTQTLRLKTPELPPNLGPFRFQPGQFILVRPFVESHNKVIPRAYSISSSPTRSIGENRYFEITVRQTENPTVSKWINGRIEGDKIPFRGPYGNFTWFPNDPTCEQIFMLAGGCGITPMKAILEFIYDKDFKNKITLFYSCRTEKDIIFKKELSELAKKIKNINMIITLSREPDKSHWAGSRGRFGQIDIERALDTGNYNLEKTTFYLCGTPGFVTGMIKTLEKMGVTNSRIKREKWS